MLFPFGYGLSYTVFKVDDVRVNKTSGTAEDEVTVSATVENTGSVAGSQVLQVYIGPAEDNVSSVKRPQKILAGWAKARNLVAGKSETVSISVPLRAVQYWDEEKYSWVVPKGKYSVTVATSSSSKDVVSRQEVEIPEEATFKP